MSALRLAVAACAVLLSLGGCQRTTEIILNPDGTGKVNIEQTGLVAAFHKPDSILDPWPEVAAWGDCSVKTAGGNRTMRGTAFFEDLSKIKLQGHPGPICLESSVNKAGNRVIRFAPLVPATQPKGSVADDDVRRWADGLRKHISEWDRQGKSLAAASRSTFRIRVPGRIVRVSNMRLAGDGAAEVDFRGEKVVAALEKLSRHDAMLRAVAGPDIYDGYAGPILFRYLCKELFGSDGPVELEFKPDGKPLFDYRGEVKAAGEDWFTKAVRGLGGQVRSDAGTVVAITSIDYYEDERSTDSPVWRFVLKARFPFAVARGTCHVYRVIDGDGTLLTSGGESGWGGIEPRQEAQNIIFTTPAPASPTLRELSGILNVIVPGPTKAIDVGIVDLKAGSKGGSLGFTIRSAEVDEKRAKIALRLDKPYGVLRIAFRSDSGQEIHSLDVDPTVKKSDFSVVHYGKRWPDSAKVIVTLAENARSVDVPFLFRDIRLRPVQEP